jgi:chemotaxis protein CheZ
VHDTRAYLKDVPPTADAINAQLIEILMAQDFQDLTGQVIKKMMEVVNDVETQLLQVLIDNVPAEKRQEISTHNSMLNGPQIHAGAADAVADQSQVDDLLESLGF